MGNMFLTGALLATPAPTPWLLYILAGTAALAVLVILVMRGHLDQLNRPKKGWQPPAGAPSQPERSEFDDSMIGTLLVTDPVCGKRISLQGALVRRLDNRVAYFCSPECRTKFVFR